MLVGPSQNRLTPPSLFRNEAEALVTNLRSPWFQLVARLHDRVTAATARYAEQQGVMNLHLPLTTRTVTCPSALGSDSAPVPVTVGGVDTYLPDSMQFMLEYGCPLVPDGCYSILPSFRGDQPDTRHLSQFTHSEVEIPGGLDEVIAYVDGYVKALAATILDDLGDVLEPRWAMCRTWSGWRATARRSHG